MNNNLICSNCGASNYSDSVFCSNCGKQLVNNSVQSNNIVNNQTNSINSSEGNILGILSLALFKILKLLFICPLVSRGIFLLAITYNMFFLKYDLVTGGTSGLAIIINHLFDIDPALFIFVVEIFLLILSFILLGAKRTDCVGNLKFAGSPLPLDANKKQEITSAIGNKKVFLISSTHHNEEEQFALHLKELKRIVEDVKEIIENGKMA